MEKGPFSSNPVKGRSSDDVIIFVDRGMGSTPIVGDTEENIWPLVSRKLRNSQEKKK
jgi:hypothetical protein